MNNDLLMTDASFRLKKNYETLLLEFEFHQYPHHRFADAISRSSGPLPSLQAMGLIDGKSREEACIALVLLSGE